MNKLRIVSDRWGLFLEGVETVKTAVRQTREANVLVFVVLDNPVNKVRIVSDSWGLFLERVETVKTAVRQAREANVFLVFAQ